jgi:hypothetical protein
MPRGYFGCWNPIYGDWKNIGIKPEPVSERVLLRKGAAETALKTR